jgi:hypothetical protein
MQTAQQKQPQPPPPRIPDPPPRMTLEKAVRGRLVQPLRLILYGPPGIGKSTFAAGSPDPIFLGAEKGTAQLDVVRFAQPESWQDVLDGLRILETQAHAFKTVVLDTLDWIEPLIHQAVLAEENKGKDAARSATDLDSMGYGRGYNLALTQWRKLISYLERLSDTRGMNILMLAHSQIKSFKNPEGEDFDRYEMKLYHKAGGLLQEWADEVLFANYEIATHEKKGRVRGISSGARIIHTTRTAAYDAKNRHGLPDELPLSWADYSASVTEGAPANRGAILQAINELLEDADEELITKVQMATATANNDSIKLTLILNRLKAMRKE